MVTGVSGFEEAGITAARPDLSWELQSVLHVLESPLAVGTPGVNARTYVGCVEWWRAGGTDRQAYATARRQAGRQRRSVSLQA